jgi:hypothetical protein
MIMAHGNLCFSKDFISTSRQSFNPNCRGIFKQPFWRCEPYDMIRELSFANLNNFIFYVSFQIDKLSFLGVSIKDFIRQITSDGSLRLEGRVRGTTGERPG